MNLRFRSLAKIFGPVLLTTTLVLPAELLVAPPFAHAAPKVERGEKNNEKNKQRNQARDRGQAKAQQRQREQVKQSRGQQRRQQVQAQGQQRREVRRIQQQREKQIKLQAQQQRQAQIQRQQYQRRVQLERQAESQRQAELRRQADLRRQTQIRRDNRNYYPRGRQHYGPGSRYYRGDQFRYDGRYYGPNDRFHIDGFVVDEGSGCSLFKDHATGHIFALVGNVGDIQQGDHMRLQGRVVDGGVCDWRGTGFEVVQVKTLWDNNRHEHALYDYQRDRITFEQYLDRHDYRDDRYGYGDW